MKSGILSAIDRSPQTYNMELLVTSLWSKLKLNQSMDTGSSNHRFHQCVCLAVCLLNRLLLCLLLCVKWERDCCRAGDACGPSKSVVIMRDRTRFRSDTVIVIPILQMRSMLCASIMLSRMSVRRQIIQVRLLVWSNRVFVKIFTKLFHVFIHLEFFWLRWHWI